MFQGLASQLFQTPVPQAMTVAGAVDTLTVLGVIGVIVVAATIGLAAVLWKTFKRG